jgi:hypothetical protein
MNVAKFSRQVVAYKLKLHLYLYKVSTVLGNSFHTKRSYYMRMERYSKPNRFLYTVTKSTRNESSKKKIDIFYVFII